MENPKLLNPLTLAFMGDAVYEQYIRENIIIKHGSLSANKLHRMAVSYVCAAYQAKVYDAIVDTLDENELAVLKRGRNSSSVSSPKNGVMSEYRKATGVETLFGYLHLVGYSDRLNELLKIAISIAED